MGGGGKRWTESISCWKAIRAKWCRPCARIGAHPHVDGEFPKRECPLAKTAPKVLDYALKKAESFGFETLNDENYAGHVAFGGGSGRTLGILAHLDVVPEGEDWTVPPYEAIVKDGYVYGRGSTDNKCSCVSCLYACAPSRRPV